MKNEKFSINKLCIFISTLLVSLFMATAIFLYLLTDNSATVYVVLFLTILVFACIFSFIAIVRKKLTAFSDMLCEQLDGMIQGNLKNLQFDEEETLFNKITYRLSRLYSVMCENRQSIAREREDLQGLISDVSHQVKTPIANLKMIESTLIEQDMTKQKQKEFLSAMGGQLDKLDFLMQALIKTSRLETGIISLEKKKQPIYDTLAAALGGILLNAEKKNIEVLVHCPESIEVSHDRKWTSEALFNILDNAVKYTSEGGKIRVKAEKWELYLKIDISDNGRGIPEKHHAEIFKRFYRESDVHDIDGIGIGLYLTREIITMQGGYVKVTSSPKKGATFSVFLPVG